MKNIDGGVAAPLGFTASGIHCGIRKNKEKKDLALIFADRECAAAAVYTTNRVKAAPIYKTMEHLESGTARAALINSGNANACAPNGSLRAGEMCSIAADALGIAPEDVIVSSTGIIGVELDVTPIKTGMEALVSALSRDGSGAAAEAIMTTDTVKKEISVELELGGKPVRIGGIGKGSGMIAPNMATMLVFITTDAAITPHMLHESLSFACAKTFNRIVVDGDTSTNDMCAAMASGLAGNPQIEWKDEDYDKFTDALMHVTGYLSKMIAKDGEGATRLVACTVWNARGEETAEKLAKAVVASSLVKAAMFGADANWGRVLCAMGYSKAPFRPEYVDVRFRSEAGEILVCENGAGLDFSEELAKQILIRDEVTIDIDIKEGAFGATAWGCDLTYDYVKINGDYRT